jgi:hypothetical protein
MRPRTLSTASLLLLGFLSTLAYAQEQFTERPTEYSSNCAFAYNNPPYAYDDNFSTASSQNLAQGGKGGKSACETWSGFASASGATDIQLNVSSSASVSSGSGAVGAASLSYSLDGGQTFNDIYYIAGTTSVNKQTFVINLSGSANLTEVQVKGYITVVSGNDNGAGATQSIYEIWITGND